MSGKEFPSTEKSTTKALDKQRSIVMEGIIHNGVVCHNSRPKQTTQCK